MRHSKPIAIVTGAASGLGRVALMSLVKRGYAVVALDIDQRGLSDLENQQPLLKSYQCNVADPDQVESIIEDVVANFGNISRLVHAAGVMPMGRLTDMSSANVVRMMRINYEGTVYITKAVLKSMLPANQGDVVVFGSLAGELRSPNLGAYCASKAATNTYMRELIRENADTDIRFLLVCPTMVNTPLLTPEKTHVDDSWIFRVSQWGLLLEPSYVIDAIERSLEKGKKVLYPGIPGKLGLITSRLIPHFAPKIMEMLEPKMKEATYHR